MKRVSLALLGLVLAIVFWSALRPRLRMVPPPGPRLLEKSENVRIFRDEWGVPHVFGETDADAAFGLAYAMAEDDFATLKLNLAAAAGKLSLLKLSGAAIESDHLARLFGIRQEIERDYSTKLSPEFRRVLDGYADGLNLYVALHTAEADSRFYPYTGRDIAAVFLFRLPILEGVRKALGMPTPSTDSTAYAVARARTPDDVTRLLFSSEGAEAQVVSEEGWNMSGATFSGSPVILQGTGGALAWALTVNQPPLVDTFSLEMDPQHPDRYRFDGEWRELERLDADITVDLGPFDWTIHRDAFHSVHGPAMKRAKGVIAFRYAGMGGLLPAIEQVFEMNRATNFAEWKKAMGRQALPMFNALFADREHLYYVYNALLPMREETPKAGMLPGNASRFVWKEYLTYDKLPFAQDPPSGFFQIANASPFSVTKGEGNPMATDLHRALGVETGMNARALTLLELLGGAGTVTHEQLISFRQPDDGALQFEVEFTPKGVEAFAISRKGASARPKSKHFADQAPYFARGELRRHWRTEKELRAHQAVEYHPGEELKRAQ